LIIELSKDEVRVCTTLAVERWLAKFGSTDKPNYAKGKEDGKLEPEINANIRANVCEWAVAKCYNLSWNVPWYPNELHRIRYGLPDVGNNIEVRSVRTMDSIPFWEKDLDKIIVGTKCLDTSYYSKVEVYGHINPLDFNKPEYYDNYIQGWRVPTDMFKQGALNLVNN
jgi:hypothetical protein